MTIFTAESNPPHVTVGMPVFNGAATLAHAIESILQQTYRDFRLIISDNASTDETRSICERFASIDQRISYIRQQKNLGAEANFDFVLKEARSEYFMWAAADDTRSSDFLAVCVEFLDSHPEYVAANCATRYAGGSTVDLSRTDFSLEDDDFNNNILNVFQPYGRLRLNSRFYALFKRASLEFWLTEPKKYLGSDWSLVIRVLRHGKFKRLDAGYTEIGRHGASKQLDIFKSYRSHFIHWFVPFLELSKFAWNSMESASPRQKLVLLTRLIFLNARTLKKQAVSEAKLRFRGRASAR